MKKGLALFLLAIMALVAVQPVIAMHFCEGELYSWRLFASDDELSCCQPETAGHSCCGTHSSDNPDCNLNNAAEDCCDFETIRVATDDYQKQIQEFNSDKLALTLENVWLTLNNLLGRTAAEPNTTLLQNDFPPKGLFLHDVSLLTYICIYRI